MRRSAEVKRQPALIIRTDASDVRTVIERFQMNGLTRRIAGLLGGQVAARAFCGSAAFVKRGSVRASCGSICQVAKRTRISRKAIDD